VGPGSPEGDFIDWLTIKSQTESVARCSTHQVTSARPRLRAGIRLWLWRKERPVDRGAGSNKNRPACV